MPAKNIPFEFVTDYLAPLEVTVKPMFGMFALYVRGKIVLMLREKAKDPVKNGVWIATTADHHQSLKKDFPSLRPISSRSGAGTVTGWQLLPADADDFESSVIKACEYIKRGDSRIGKLPKPGKAKK